MGKRPKLPPPPPPPPPPAAPPPPPAPMARQPIQAAKAPSRALSFVNFFRSFGSGKRAATSKAMTGTLGSGMKLY